MTECPRRWKWRAQWKRVDQTTHRNSDSGVATQDTGNLCRLDAIPDGGVLGLYPPDPAGMPLLLARDGNSLLGWLSVCPQDGGRRPFAPGWW